MTEDQSQSIGGLQRRIAETIDATSDAMNRLAGPTDEPGASVRLRHTYGDLIDAYGRLSRALERTETVLDNFDDGPETPRRIKDEHSERLEEQYDGPVWYIAVQLAEHNRRKWLWQKPETNGAADVRRHGLTNSQREWLNDLQDAWRAYDGDSIHRQTFADDSPSGEQYTDDRTPLAYAYEGDELLAIAYKEKVVREWLDDAWFDVSLTPAGEERIGGDR